MKPRSVAVRQTNPGGQRAARCLCWMLRPKRTFCGAARCMNSISGDTGGEFASLAGKPPFAPRAKPNSLVGAGWADRLAHE